MKTQFIAWPVDEGEYGIRLDIDTERRCDLPPCPGPGWIGQNGAWWTRVKGAVAVELAAKLSATRAGFYQNVVVEMDGDRLVAIRPE